MVRHPCTKDLKREGGLFGTTHISVCSSGSIRGSARVSIEEIDLRVGGFTG